MVNSSFIQLPQDVSDPQQLRRFLDKLILQIDIAFGNRGNIAFATTSEIASDINSIQETLDYIISEEKKFIRIDGSIDFTNIVKYSSDLTFTDDKSLIAKKYADDKFELQFSKNTAFNKNFGTVAGTVTEGGTTTNNPQQSAISNLNQTISDPPTQAEVQAISDKIDIILSALRNANII
jgi:hypothetical protein